MLALKTGRCITPILSAAAARNASGCSSKSAAFCATTMGCQNKQQNDKVANNFICNTAIAPFVFTSTRFYTSRPPTPPSTSSSSSSSPSSSSSSSASSPGLPDRQQVEKYFFKTVAFLWDASVWTYEVSSRNFEKYVIKNPTVQLYWKQFLEKLEKARKD